MTDSEKDALIEVMREGIKEIAKKAIKAEEWNKRTGGIIRANKESELALKLLNSPSLQKHIEIQKAKDEVVEKARELLMCGKTPDVWKEHTDALDKLQESLDRLTQLTKE